MKRYFAKPDTWYDEGTEAFPLTEFFEAYDDHALTIRNDWALFEGIKDGKPDEETCTMAEFNIVEEAC